jgi:hypothetical protein
MCGKANAFERIQNAGSALRKCATFSFARITRTVAPTGPNNTARSAGLENSVIFEIREDDEGEDYHLVTLWKATRQEQSLYEEHS